MSATPPEGIPRTAIDTLKAELDRLADAEESALLDADVAKSKATSIARQRKNVAKAIRLLTGRTTGSLTKKALEDLLNRALSQGPLPEKELRSRLETHLKREDRSINGLGLLMAQIKARYASDDGRWALPTPKSSEGS